MLDKVKKEYNQAIFDIDKIAAFNVVHEDNIRVMLETDYEYGICKKFQDRLILDERRQTNLLVYACCRRFNENILSALIIWTDISERKQGEEEVN